MTGSEGSSEDMAPRSTCRCWGWTRACVCTAHRCWVAAAGPGAVARSKRKGLAYRTGFRAREGRAAAAGNVVGAKAI